MADLKARITEVTKEAMKARDKARVAALRMVNAEIKRVEVDERRELAEADVLAVLNRMLKQRRDSLKAFEEAGRDDLASQERFEIELLQTFLPEPLSDPELEALIDAAVADTGATGMKDMGNVMSRIRAAAEGRADLGQVSARVKARLG